MVNQKEIKNKTQVIIKPHVGQIVLAKKIKGWKIYVAWIQSTSRPNLTYQVQVMVHDSGALRFKCPCEAGRVGMVCKHISATYNALVHRGFKANIDLTSQGGQ